MKPERIKWLAPSVLLLLLFSCDIFLALEKPRDNPNDPDNPTPGVTDLKAYGYSANSVILEWLTNTDENDEFPDVVIVRNSIQEPTGINDGTQVYSGPTTIADGDSYASFIDDTADSETDYYYAIWSYTGQDGTITYNGPLTDTATTQLQEVELFPDWDGYLFWDGPTAYFEAFDPMDTNRLQWWDSTEEYYILLSFDFSNAPDFGEIDECRLQMYKDIDGVSFSWTVSAGRILQSWSPTDDPYITRDNIVANSFRDFSDDDGASTVVIPNGPADFYEWDVTSILSSWLVDGEPNRGILIRSRTNDGSGTFEFFAAEHFDGFRLPRLMLKFYGDNPDIE